MRPTIYTAKLFTTALLSLTIAVSPLFASATENGTQDGTNGKVVEVAEREELVSRGMMSKLDDALDRIDIKAKLEKSTEISEDFSIGARWERRLEPSYKEGFTTLVDDFRLNSNFHPSALSDSTDGWSWGVGLGHTIQVMFARQFEGRKFKEHLKILTERPYTPLSHLPSNVEKAKSRMKIGDFVSLQANMNIIISASTLQQISGHFTGTISPYYLVSGEFQIHLFRISEDKFRMKLIAIRNRQKGLNVRIGFDPGSDFQVVGINIIDRRIRSKLKFTPLEFSFWTPNNNLFMVDYTMNLNDKNVGEAYNEIIDSVWKMKTLRILNPFNDRETLRKMLLADVTSFEEIYETERQKPVQDRVLDRMFSGANDIVDGTGFNLELGLSYILELKTRTNYNENHISFKDRNGLIRYFSMPTYASIDGFKALFGYFGEETLRSASILFETNSVQKVQSYGELSFYMDYKDRKFSTSEIKRLKNHIHNVLPDEMYNQIQWGDWTDERDRINAHVTTLLVFRPQALPLIMGMSQSEIYHTLLRYILDLPEIEAAASDANLHNSDSPNYNNRSDRETYYRSDLNSITNRLADILNPDLDKNKRAEAFSNMRHIALWREIAPGFLVKLLLSRPGMDHLQATENIYFETTWSAKDSDTLNQGIGPCKNRKLYKAIMYIYSLLNNRSIDLRLIDDQDPSLPDDSTIASCKE